MQKNIKKGALIDIISPSSPITTEELKNIQNYLKNLGFESRYFLEDELVCQEKPNHKFPISDAAKRFDQLKMAIEASDSEVIWCSCGGYGASDVIEFLQKEVRTTQNKIFIGYSDITNLATFLGQNWGWQTIYGPMLRQLSNKKLHPDSEKVIFDLICNEDYSYCSKFHISALNEAAKNNEIEAPLVGGCLSVIANTLATKNQLHWQDNILLLEDIEEKGEKIDRLLVQLLTIFQETKILPRAILLGNFTQYIEDQTLKHYIAEALNNFARNISQKFPEIAIFEEKKGLIGHSDSILPVVLYKNALIKDNFFLQNN